MLYLIGLGLNLDSISKSGLEIVKRCKKIYLESYTVDFPYSVSALQEVIGKKIIPVDRDFVESYKIIDEAKKMDVALLVYGNPLTATTHISLLHEAKLSKIKCKVIHNASILDAVAETGLQLYKFGKVASMPSWDYEKKFTPDSFMKIIQENLSINAHSLLLVDIGLPFDSALQQLEKAAENYNIKLKKIIICQALGTKHSKIIFKDIKELIKDKKKFNIKSPYCIILPAKLHFFEKEILESFE